MNTAKLTLLGCPSLLASILLASLPAHASEVVVKPTNKISSAPTQSREIVFERPTIDATTKVAAQTSDDSVDYDCGCSNESSMLEFSEDESRAAINRYGCDCAGCMNAVRQLQGKPPLL